MKSLSYLLSGFALSLLFITTGCDKDETVEPTEGKLNIQFSHNVNGSALAFDTIKYVTENSDTFSVTSFRYYISNIKLIKSIDGADELVYTEPESYHLINARNESNSFTLNTVPLSSYNVLEFAIGVDSSVNKTLDNTGDLDPDNDMYWGWNSGYIFVKAEGRFLKADGTQAPYLFHPGTNPNYKVVRLNLTTPVVVGGSETYTLTLNTNVAEIFKSPTTIDLNQMNNVKMGANAAIIANNYEDMISFGGLSR